jgi:hypothetical protein
LKKKETALFFVRFRLRLHWGLRQSGCAYWRGLAARVNRLRKVPSETKVVPQGLKPHCKQNTCGTATAKAVPLSETGFFRSLFSRALSAVPFFQPCP